MTNSCRRHIHVCNLFVHVMIHGCRALTEEITLEIFGSPDWTVFLSTLLSDGDSRLLSWKLVWDSGDSRENLFESYGDSRENWFEILAVVIISSPISSARGDSWIWGGSWIWLMSPHSHDWRIWLNLCMNMCHESSFPWLTNMPDAWICVTCTAYSNTVWVMLVHPPRKRRLQGGEDS